MKERPHTRPGYGDENRGNDRQEDRPPRVLPINAPPHASPRSIPPCSARWWTTDRTRASRLPRYTQPRHARLHVPVVHGQRGVVEDGVGEPGALGVGGDEGLEMSRALGGDGNGGNCDGRIGHGGEEGERDGAHHDNRDKLGPQPDADTDSLNQEGATIHQRMKLPRGLDVLKDLHDKDGEEHEETEEQEVLPTVLTLRSLGRGLATREGVR